MRGSGGTTINTIGAEIEKGFSAAVRYDRRQYDQFSNEELLDFRRRRGEDVHQHKREESVFLGISMAFSERWDLSLLLPYNRFTGFKDNSDEFAVANDTISRTSVSEGLGDRLGPRQGSGMEKCRSCFGGVGWNQASNRQCP